MKPLLLLLILTFTFFGYSQRESQIGTRLKFNNNNQFYSVGNSSYPDFYSHRDFTINIPSFAIYGRTTTPLSFDSTKFKIKHTFEVGLSKSRLNTKTTRVLETSIWEQDTIGYIRESSSKVTQLEISNYIDFCFKLSEKHTIINSLGFKIETPLSGKSLKSSQNIS